MASMVSDLNMMTLQEAMALPENTASLRTRKYTAIVDALKTKFPDYEHGMGGNILDEDGDLDFGEGSPVYSGWNGSTNKFAKLSAQKQRLILKATMIVINSGNLQGSMVPEQGTKEGDFGGSGGMGGMGDMGGFGGSGGMGSMSGFSPPPSPQYPFGGPQQHSSSSSSAFQPIPQQGVSSSDGGGIGGGGDEVEGGGGGSKAAPIPPPPEVLTTLVDTNAFAPYQRAVQEAMNNIEEAGRGRTIAELDAQRLEAILRNVYEVFFGINYTDGTMTDFHKEHGAAPIAGMTLPEVVTQATTAQQAQRAAQRRAETVFGFFSTFLQPLIARRATIESSTGQKMSDAAWSQRGADAHLNDPLRMIFRLLNVLQDIHVAGSLLVRSDPLFIANRAERAAQGHLAVRTFWGDTSYAIARAGYSVLRNIIGSMGGRGTQIAVEMDAGMPAAYRSGSIAIMNFERALSRFDSLYQSLPNWARLCWTLPYSRDNQKYNGGLPRWQNKPGAAEAALAEERHDDGLLMVARGTILEEFDPATYMAALTTISVPITGTSPVRYQTTINGPLLAYYYALHGGRMLYLREGREWIHEAFLQNPARFIQELGSLRDTMAALAQRFPRRHRRTRADTSQIVGQVIAEGSLEQRAARAMMDRNLTQTQRDDAEKFLREYFKRLVGTGIVGSAYPSGQAALCRPQEPRASCMARLRQVPGQVATAVARKIHPQHSRQQGAQPVTVDALFKGSDPVQQHLQQQRWADERSEEVGAERAKVQESRAQMGLTREFQHGLRQDAVAAQKGEMSRLSELPSQQATAHLRSSGAKLKSTAAAFADPQAGVLAIVNSPVYLYTRLEATNRYQRQPARQVFRILDNLFGQRPTTPKELEQYYFQVGKMFVSAALKHEPLRSGDLRFAFDANTVHNIALRILENPYWSRLLGLSVHVQSQYKREILKYGKWLGGSNQGKPPPGGSQGGGRRKRTRKHKKKKKRTRRHKYRHKRTRHRRRKKRHTRKH